MEEKQAQQAGTLNEGSARAASPELRKAGSVAAIGRFLIQRPWVMTIIGAVFLFVYSWSLIVYGNIKTEGAWWSSQKQAVDAVGAALSNEVYRTETTRLEQILQRIVREGGYRSASFTTLEGEVLSTTDAALKGQKFPELARTSWKSSASGPASGAVISRKIGLAEDNPRGVLRVVLNPRE